MTVKAGSDRVRSMFGQYVDPQVAGLLLDSPQTLPAVSGVRELTVLFADIRHFTTLFESVSPDELRIFLGEFYDYFAEVILARQAMLDKFMGDAALVVFGALVDLKEPSIQAIEVARELVAGFDDLCRRWTRRFSSFATVGLGVGISRGEMYMGNVGSGHRLDFTVIGRDVSIAQRLASATAPGQTLVSESVFMDVRGHLRMERQPDLSLHGLNNKMVNYRLILDELSR